MLSHLIRRPRLLPCAIFVAILVGESLVGNNVVRGADEPQVADLILLRGKIVTVNEQFSLAEALAVKGDRLLAVGSNAEIEKLRGPQTQVVDLGGKTVIPGLIDSHVHPTGASMYEFDHPIPEMETVGDVLTYVAGRAAQLEPGQWISLRQVFITRLRDQRYPTRAELDQAAPKNPVVFATGPEAMLNSLALAASNIGKDFKVPEGSTGQVELDPQGEPTGMLRSCSRLIKSQSNGKSATDADRYERLKQMLVNYNQVGLTSICDRDSGPGGIALYRALREKNELTCRVFINHNLDSSGDWEAVEKRIVGLANDPLHAYNNQLWLRGIKMYLDGGMLTGSA